MRPMFLLQDTVIKLKYTISIISAALFAQCLGTLELQSCRGPAFCQRDSLTMSQ